MIRNSMTMPHKESRSLPTWGRFESSEPHNYAVSQAQHQAPNAGRQQWQAVAERVVVSLVTTDVETVP